MPLPAPRSGLPLRRLVFWLHLIVGFAAGAVIFVMSVTGVALTYEDQIVDWAERGLHRTPSFDEVRLGLADLEVAALAGRPDDVRITSVVQAADPSAPVEVRRSDRTSALLDPYTGEVRGERAEGVRAFFGWVTRVHRWFALEGDARSVARAVTGASNLAFLFLLVTGLWLWWPRRLTGRALRAVGLLRTGVRGRVRDYNWHHVFGFWSAIPLIVVVASATVFYYGWANDLAYRIVGDEPGGGGRGGAAPESPPADPGPPPPLAAVDALLPAALAHEPAWRTVTITLPDAGDRVRFSLDAGTGAQPQKRATLTLSAASGEVVEWAPYDSLSPGRRFRSMLRFAHTGEAWGWIGQTVAGLASLAGVILVWTGTALGLRRLGLIRRRRPTTPVRDPDPDSAPRVEVAAGD